MSLPRRLTSQASSLERRHLHQLARRERDEICSAGRPAVPNSLDEVRGTASNSPTNRSSSCDHPTVTIVPPGERRPHKRPS